MMLNILQINPLIILFFVLFAYIGLFMVFYIFFFKILFRFFKIFLVINLCFLFFIQGLMAYIWINFDAFLLVTEYNQGFQYFFFYEVNSLYNIVFCFGLDGFSLLFILLTVFIFSLCSFITLYLNSSIFFQLSLFIVLIILEFILIFVFSVLDLFFFYIGFESSLIPMFFIVGL